MHLKRITIFFNCRKLHQQIQILLFPIISWKIIGNNRYKVCFIRLISYYFSYYITYFFYYFSYYFNTYYYFSYYFSYYITYFYYYFLLFQGESVQFTGASRHTSSSYAQGNDWRVYRRTGRAFGRAWELASSSKVSISRRSKPIILLIFSIIPIISNVLPGFSVW